MKVGWYVHHHGAGHRTRAMTVGARLAARGQEVTLLGSELEHRSVINAGLTPVRLAQDYPLDEGHSAGGDDLTVGGLMHWAPLRHRGFQERMTTIARWVQVHEPDVFVVDVSCEVAMLTRLLGIPVVVVAQPGDRTDAAHTAALTAAAAVLAPWPAWASEALWQTSSDPALVVAVGGIAGDPWSPGMATEAVDGSPTGEGPRRLRGVVLVGAEGFDSAGLPATVVRSVPWVEWSVVGGSAWVPNVRELLARADVVVTHAGQNAIADVATAAVPAVIVPQQRPFAEQDHMAGALASSGLAAGVERGDVANLDWSSVVSGVLSRGGQGWTRWGCAGAVGRAASLIEVVGSG